MSPKKLKSSTPKTHQNDEPFETKTNPTYITNYLMYENGYFWYQVECCETTNHFGVFITNSQHDTGDCWNNKVPMPPPTSAIETSIQPISKSSTANCPKIYTPPNFQDATYLAWYDSNNPDEEPTGCSRPYLIAFYVTIENANTNNVPGIDPASLKGLTIKGMQPANTLTTGRIYKRKGVKKLPDASVIVKSYSSPILECEVTFTPQPGQSSTYHRVFCILEP